MIYETLLRLFGVGIIGLIQFLPLNVHYDPGSYTLTVNTILRSPVTGETRRLVENGWRFGIDYSISFIINDQRVYRHSIVHELRWNRRHWCIDSVTHAMPFDSIQCKMGSVAVAFPGFKFDEGDKVIFFITAAIRPDSLFTASTGMQPEVLWNCHLPKRKETHVFSKGRFMLQ